MPRPGHNNTNEKSKDFFGSMKRLIKNLKPWKVLMILALTLAMASALISLVAPNKLSDFTNVITNGLKPDNKKLEEIVTKITNNLNEEKIMNTISYILEDETGKFTEEDKLSLKIILKDLSNKSDKNLMQIKLLSLPENILVEFFNNITIDETLITKKDQIEFLKQLSNMDNNNQEESLKVFDQFPTSIYNLVKPTINMDDVKYFTILLASLYIISAIFSYIQNISMTIVSNNFARNLRSRISNKINKLPLKYFDTHENGDILSRVTNDIDMIGHNLNQSLATLVTSITLFIGSIIMMFVTNWIMAITAILSSLIGFMFMFLILGKSQKYFDKRQEELGKLNGYIEEMYSGHNVVKAYNGEEEAIKNFNKLNIELYESNRKSQFLSGLMHPIMGFIGNFGYVAVCVVGALLTMNNIISFGVIVAFTIYVRLFTNPLSQMAQAMTSLQSTAAASERVFEFLDEKEMNNEENLTKVLDKNNVKGNIEFNNVSFGYNEEKTIINNFTAKISSGQKIAIVGPTGAGKTTIVNLLMKFYDINQGEILIDGTKTKELTRKNIHDLFCMVLQDTWLFEGTVKENIKFNNEDVTDEEIWEACKIVGVDHFIKTLPGGINSNLTDTDSISSGQKQLLTIARGMIKNAPFLILDEATSNVDTRTEELVQKAMDKLTEGKTSFIIAHRLSTIKNADLILVIKDGNIIETGNHDELMMQKGFYAELYNSQFEM